jgi:RNA polymerase primary sigma factor
MERGNSVEKEYKPVVNIDYTLCDMIKDKFVENNVEVNISDKYFEPKKDEISELVEDLEKNPNKYLKRTKGRAENFEAIRLYLNDLEKYDLFTEEEEKKFTLEFYETRNPKIKHMIANANQRLVVNISKKYSHVAKGMGMNLYDVIAYGNEGLLKSIDKFEPKLGYKFSTYSSWWIKQSIVTNLTNKGGSVRIPTNMREFINNYKKSYQQLINMGIETPTNEQLAEKSNLPVKKIEEIKNVITKFENVVSLNAPIGEDGDELFELIEKKQEFVYMPENVCIYNSLKDSLNDALSALSTRDEKIIRYRYGLDLGEPMTLEQIGNIFGMTRERIRQIVRDGLKDLKRNRKIRLGLEGYL